MSDKDLTYNHDVFLKFLNKVFSPHDATTRGSKPTSEGLSPLILVKCKKKGGGEAKVLLKEFDIEVVNNSELFNGYLDKFRAQIYGSTYNIADLDEIDFSEVRKILLDGFSEKEKIMDNNDEIVSVEVDDLYLDMKNPRLPHGVKKNEKEVLTYIATSTSIEDLMEAIAKNGFFPGEPLVVVREEGKLVVVEGNRRLSSVKLINDFSLIDNPGKVIKEISNSVVKKIERLPVVIKDSRSDVLPYLGFRHITGVKQWDPLSKARYMKQIFDLSSPSVDPVERYREVARTIGSKSNHIKRSLDALAVYEEIESEGFYEIEGLDEENIKFAVLSTALADERIACFVGTATKDVDGDTEYQHPIVNKESLNKDNIRYLTNWLYKRNESGATKVGESRNLKRLGAIVETDHALKAFMGGSSLDYAFRLSKGSDEEFLELLYSAQAAVQTAASLVATTEFSQEAFDAASDISKTIRMVGTALKEKKVVDDEF